MKEAFKNFVGHPFMAPVRHTLNYIKHYSSFFIKDDIKIYNRTASYNGALAGVKAVLKENDTFSFLSTVFGLIIGGIVGGAVLWHLSPVIIGASILMGAGVGFKTGPYIGHGLLYGLSAVGIGVAMLPVSVAKGLMEGTGDIVKYLTTPKPLSLPPAEVPALPTDTRYRNTYSEQSRTSVPYYGSNAPVVQRAPANDLTQEYRRLESRFNNMAQDQAETKKLLAQALAELESIKNPTSLKITKKSTTASRGS